MSILKTKGTIQPIVIDQDYNIIAGERRTRAMRLLNTWSFCVSCDHMQEPFFINCPLCGEERTHSQLDWNETEAIQKHVEDDFERKLLEYEENLEREPLTAAEKIDAISELHKLYQEQRGGTGFGKGWGQVDTAKKLGITDARVSQTLKTKRILDMDPTLREEGTESGIWAKFKRQRIAALRAELARRQAGALESLVTWFEGDAVENMDSVGEASIDLFLTDIPYGISVFGTQHMGGSSHGVQFDDSRRSADDLIRRLAYAVARVLKDNSHGFIFCAWEQTFEIMDRFTKAGLHVEVPPWIWDKKQALPSRNPGLNAGGQYEYIVHFRKGSPELGIDLGSNIRVCQKVNTPKYPNEKPVALLKELIHIASPEKGTVLDCCCGSGATIIAALESGRKAIGIDSNPEALNIAKSRLSEVKVDE